MKTLVAVTAYVRSLGHIGVNAPGLTEVGLSSTPYTAEVEIKKLNGYVGNSLEFVLCPPRRE